MKKIKGLIFIALISFLFVACTNKNEINLKDVKPFYVNGITASPQNAKVEDGALKLQLMWKKGTDEDSMKKYSFLSTGTLFSATQNNKQLEWDLKASTNMGYEIYEASEGSVYPVFKLDNNEDDVTVKLYNGASPDLSKEFIITIKK